MARNDEFRLNVSAFVKKAKLAPNLVLRKIALDLFTAVVKRTPVDTGMLRGNWQVGLGSMPSGTVTNADKGGNRVLQEIESKAAKAEWGTSIYLVNNLPYASVVEYGAYPNPVKRGTYVRAGQTKYGVSGPAWVKRTKGGFSLQAPAGMVRVSVVELQSYMDRIIRSMGT